VSADVEDGQVESHGARAPGDGELARDAFDAWPEKYYHDANAGLGLEDHHEHTNFVIFDEEAELFPLLVDAIEVRLVHQTVDGLGWL